MKKNKEDIVSIKSFLVLLGLAFLLYGNTLTHHYNLDDYFVVRENKQVLKGISAIPEIFFSQYFENSQVKFGYRPVTKAIFAIEVSIFGNNLMTHHFFNVFYFAILCFLILVLLSKIFSSYSKYFIWAILLLWMFHPVRTEVVNSLKNREEIIYLIFSIISVLFFIKYFNSGKVLFLFSGLISFIFSYLTKESAISFSFAMPLIIGFLMDKEKNIIMFFDKKNFKKSLFNFLNDNQFVRFVTISVVIIIVTYILYKLPKLLFPHEKIDLLEFENPLHLKENKALKIPIIFYSLIFYMKIFVIPYPLLFYYGLYKVPELSFFSFEVIASIIINVLILLFCLKYYKKYKEIVFGIILFYIMIFPFINYLVPINGVVAERFLNAPSLGLSIAAVSFILRNYDLRNFSFKSIKKPVKYIFTLMILIFTFLTWNRNKYWKDEITLYSHDINYLENSIKANDILAQVIMDRIMKNVQLNKPTSNLKESIDSALKYWKKSLSLFPLNAKACNNIANIYLNFYNNIDSTMYYLKKGYNINPQSFHINFNIGYCYELLKQDSLALVYYRSSLKIDSNNIQAWSCFINTHFRLNNFDSAFQYAMKMKRKFPESDFPYSSIGYYYLLQKDTATAVQYWEKSFSINPHNLQRAMSLYKYFLSKKDTVKANYYYKFLKTK